MPDRCGRIRQWRHALLAACAALALAACQRPAAPMDSHDLSLAAGDIASLAAEATLFTGQLVDGSVTANFAWVHQQALGRASVDVADRLAHPVTPSSQDRHEQLLQLHARLDAALQRIGAARHERQQLEELHTRFTRIGALAAALREQP